MEEIKKKIQKLVRIPVNLYLPEGIDEKHANMIKSTISNHNILYINADDAYYCNMLFPITIKFGFNLSTSDDSYVLSTNISDDVLIKELNNIYENEISKDNREKKGFLNIFKKPNIDLLKREADTYFLNKNYLIALEKYKEISKFSKNLHFKEVQLYCSILLEETHDLSFLFSSEFIDTPRQYRVLNILIDLLQLSDKNIFKVIQSISLMKESEKKFNLIERLLNFKCKLATHLYFDYLIHPEKNVLKKNEIFDFFYENVRKNSDFLNSKFQMYLEELRNKLNIKC